MRGTPRPFRLARADTHGHTHTHARHIWVCLPSGGWVPRSDSFMDLLLCAPESECPG